MLHGYLGEYVGFGAFAIVPFHRYRMVTFVAGTLPASITSDVVRPADPYVIHVFLLPLPTESCMTVGSPWGTVWVLRIRRSCCPILLEVGESEQE
jgi:hypothetical protein